jgi:chromosome partitioning protein
MTKVIAVLNQKGGCGKTTISTNLAHALSLKGYKVLLVDADPQGNARDWQEANDGNLFPVVGLDRETLPKDLAAISEGYDYVLIDGAPQIAKMTAAAIKAADMVVIPVQPSPYDIWACADTVDLIKARQQVTDGKFLAAFVISRAIKNSKLSKEVNEALSTYSLPVLKSITTQRVVYATSAAAGKTVMSESNSEAKEEVDTLTEEIIGIVNGEQTLQEVGNA